MFLQIHRNSSTPMIKQIYNQIKTMILNGELKPNFRLPSSRKLSEEYNISRIVIVEAYKVTMPTQKPPCMKCLLQKVILSLLEVLVLM